MEKRTKNLIKRTAIAVVFNVLIGWAFAYFTGISPAICITAAVGMAMVIGWDKTGDTANVGVFTEIWTGEIVKSLRSGIARTWLDGIPNNSSIVNNNVLHLVDCGVEPDVLVNNTTYPIDLQALNDKDIPISLDKFQTKVTPITSDELYACSYDKVKRVKDSHADAISLAKFAKAAHAFAPAKDTASTPVIKTSGAIDGGTATGRKTLTREDIIALKRRFDALKAPVTGRRLVLCPDHINDLLLTDQKFAGQYYNQESGTVAKLYGFEIYEFAECPLYTTAGAKKDYAAAATTGEYQASFAFITTATFKAEGTTEMFYSEAKTDPENQRNLVAFCHRFVAMPKKLEAIGAIYSYYKAA